jgi:hypothetical protein
MTGFLIHNNDRHPARVCFARLTCGPACGGRAAQRQSRRWPGISEGTVRTHQENVYTRLHLSSRTAAVTRAFPGRVA